MSSSSEVVRAVAPADLRVPERPDLRTGVWTRLGDDRVLGDDVTEATLDRLAERTRTAARAQGYAVGWAEGRREALEAAAHAEVVAEDERLRAEQRRDQEHKRALESLTHAADELQRAVDDACARVADQASAFAFEVVSALLDRELALDPVFDVVRRVLAVLPAGSVAQVRVNPAIAASPGLAALTEHGVGIVPDADLFPGDALVETDTSVIDLRVSAALERLREVLR